MLCKIVDPVKEDKINVDSLRNAKIVIASSGTKVHILVPSGNGYKRWKPLYSETSLSDDEDYTSVKSAIRTKLNYKWEVFHCHSTSHLIETLIRIKKVDINLIAKHLRE